MSQQTRSTEALEAALTEVRTAARAARNIPRVRTYHSGTWPDLDLDAMEHAVFVVGDITRQLATTLTRYASALRHHYQHVGFSTAVMEEAYSAARALDQLAAHLLLATPDGPSATAVASLRTTVAAWRLRRRQP